jgi:3-deoxy-D-manno-octulosonic-acid transferase
VFSNNFINKFSPKILLLAETELWPNILLTTIKKSIPIIIINGRISDKTLKAPAFMKQNYSRILNLVDHVFASNHTNLDRFISLGADTNKSSVLDNLKFSSTGPNEHHTHNRPIKNNYILCASTHAGEEAQILRAWNNHSFNAIQLVIAIRHPNRKKEVCDQADKLGFDYILHSQNTSNDSDCIYIIDTIGDLIPFIQHAELVFMGGSLVPNIGGHNVLEAAQFGKSILNGPYYDNFTEIIDEMIQADSIIKVNNAEELMDQAATLLNNKERCEQLGANAKKFLTDKSSVSDEYTKWIMNFIHTHSL